MDVLTPDFVGQMSIVLVLAILAGAVIGRRYGERRERERHTQAETLTAIGYLRSEQAQNAIDTQERLHRIESQMTERLVQIEQLLPKPRPAPPATEIGTLRR